MTVIKTQPVYLISYKGDEGKIQGIISKCIRFITRGKFSHSEICIGVPFQGKNLCITSAGSEGGVVCRELELNSSDWEFIQLPNVTVTSALVWYWKNKGSKYDWIGVARFMIPFVSDEHETRWFCSEASADIIGLKDPWRYDPSLLHVTIGSINNI